MLKKIIFNILINKITTRSFSSIHNSETKFILPSIDSAIVSSVKNSEQLKISIKDIINLNVYLNDSDKYKEEINTLQKQNSKILQNHLEPFILSSLESLSLLQEKCGMIILKEFPFTEVENLNQAEQVLIGLSYLLKTRPFSYLSEYKGRLIHHVRPNKEKINEYHSASSKTDLKLHIENSFDNNRPDFLMLYCLKSDKNATTNFVSVEKIFNSLSNDKKRRFLSIGLQNIFIHHSSESHEIKQIKEQAPVFTFNDSSKIYPIEMRYSPLTIGLNDEANFFLEELRDHISDLKSEIVLEAGDVCLWFNHSYLHGRSAYKPDLDDEKNKRFLLRMFLSRNSNLPMIRR